MFFHRALQDSKLFVIPVIHYFDARRLRAHLLQAPELQLHPRASNLVGPDGAGDAVEDPLSDEERDTTDAETDAETAAEEAWCPPMPDAPDDPTESEIAGDADKLETMLRGSHPSVNISSSRTILAHCRLCGCRQNWLSRWLRSKTNLPSCSWEPWLRGRIDTLETVFRLRPETYYSASRSISEIFMLADETCRDTGHLNRMSTVRHIFLPWWPPLVSFPPRPRFVGLCLPALWSFLLAGACGSSFCVVLVCPLGVACFCFIEFVWFRCVVRPWLVSLFVFCFWWLLLTPFWSGTLVLFAFTCTTQASIIIGLVCLSADWTGSLVFLTFTGLPCRCFCVIVWLFAEYWGD